MNKKKIIWILAIVFTAVLFAGPAYLLFSPQIVYEVTINGESVGFVNSLDEYNLVLSDIYTEAEELWACDLVINEEVKATQVQLWSPEASPAMVKAGIQSAATYITSGWAMVVNGLTVAYVDSEQTAQDIIEDVKNHYLPQNSKRTLVSVSIQEDISIIKGPVEPDLVMNKDAVLSLFLSGREEIGTYVVKSGDTLSGIARSYNTSLDDLHNANPSIKNDTIQVGQVLNLEISSTLLHVKTVEQLKTTESIARPIQYKANPDMTVRNDIVTQVGSDGLRTVTYQLELINGSEVKRNQVSSTVTRQPVTKSIITGIGHWPTLPNSIFRFPLNSGRITSPFGVVRRSGVHRGVDIAVAKGTPIYAAADGVVRSRGYGSSYGYYVSITHDNGYSTLYAHATSISSSVRVGEKVVRGQVIAWVGSTGQSTGNHLHWEVSRNGQLLNPMNFFGN